MSYETIWYCKDHNKALVEEAQPKCPVCSKDMTQAGWTETTEGAGVNG